MLIDKQVASGIPSDERNDLSGDYFVNIEDENTIRLNVTKRI